MNDYEIKLREFIKGRIVIYIDAANLEQSIKSMFVRPDDAPETYKHLQANTLKWSVDYRELNNFFKSLGNLRAVHFYTPEFKNDGH